MSSIGPNIAGAVFQAQFSAGETGKAADAERNKRARDSRQLARLADQQEHEVEDTDQTENVIVHRPGDEHRNGKQQSDTFERADNSDEDASTGTEKLYTSQFPPDQRTSSNPADTAESPKPDDTDSHIDLTA